MNQQGVGNDSFIASIGDGAHEGDVEAAEANARLIAAAPDLLEACQGCLQDAEDALSGDWEPSQEGWRATIDHLTRVIGKAQGK